MDELILCLRPACRPYIALASLVVLTAITSCGGDRPTAPTAPSSAVETHAPPAPAPPLGSMPAVLVGAGDIALCGPDLANAEATSRLLDGIDGIVVTPGDNTQGAGTAQEFRDCYGPTWGRHRARTRPAPGNHDWQTGSGAAYFDYFGEAAGPSGLGYYSYDAGGWHIVSLNSNVSMSSGSAQAAWLRRDLESNRTGCTLAYWHHPLVSSGPNGGSPQVREAWQILHEFGAEIVMNGHDHMYERFAPQDPSGRLDLARGIRQFTAGTGGCFLYNVKSLQPNSEVQASVHGVLKLTLREGAYDWQFIPAAGGFSDAGSGVCH